MTAPQRILVVLGHPDPAPARLCHALADAYAEGAAAAGHEVRRIDIAALDVPFLGSQQEFEKGPIPPVLKPAAEDLRWASHVVLVCPLWLGTVPAKVKAFLEQVMRPGVAFRYRDKGLPEKLFAGKTARMVVTMGMPAFAYRWFFLAHGIRGVARSILAFVGFGPVRTTYIGMNGRGAERWLAHMRELGRNAA
jgi:putative NADPH-quinone reductase